MAADNNYILYSNEKYVKGVLRIADHKLAIKFWKFQKFKMADPIWQLKNILFHIPNKNWVRGFSGLLITNLLSDFEIFKSTKWRIQYGGWKKIFYFISWWKNYAREFLGSLITNLVSDFKIFKNTQWRIQHGGWKINILFYILMKELSKGVLGVADLLSDF